MNFKKFISFFTLLVVAFPSFLSAHVGYVVSQNEMADSLGVNWHFLLSPLLNFWNIIIILGIILIVILVYLLLQTEPFSPFMTNIRKRTGAYLDFVPWVCRLALGIALLGAGSEKMLISPLVGAPDNIASLEVLLGFMILIGFMVVPSMIVAGALFSIALASNFYILGNLDFAVLIISYFILADARPGFDDLLCVPQTTFFQKFRQYVPFVVRIGLGGSMLFLALYEKILNPLASALVVNQYFLDKVVPVDPAMWVLGAGIIESAIALMFIFGFFTRTASAIAFIFTSLSFFYFGESVTSHTTLFSAFSVLFITGGGKLSFDHWLYHKQGKTEHIKSVDNLW